MYKSVPYLEVGDFIYVPYYRYEVVLNFYMNISVLFALWLIGGTNWYLMSMVVFAILKSVDALFSTKY